MSVPNIEKSSHRLSTGVAATWLGQGGVVNVRLIYVVANVHN